MREQKSQGRSRVKIAVFCVLAVHVVGLLVLLLQGCKREQPQPPADNSQMPAVTDTNLPAMDTNAAPVADTNVLASPTAVPTPPMVPAGATEHVVAKGDTLSGLATKYHTTVKAIEAANPSVSPTKLQIGQKLTIPTGTTTTADATAVTPSPAATGESLYTVKSGDTLTKIATDHKTTVKAIRSANNLTTDRITVGQKLKIPVKAAPVETAPAPAPAPAPATAPRTPGV